MIHTSSIIHGDRDRLLSFSSKEHPIIIQLGGGDPLQLAECARIVTQYGYDGINLNCGCPSPRVQAGLFGINLMLDTKLVTQCIRSMKKATHLPISVKCRIGVDGNDPTQSLPNFISAVENAGADNIIIHARKAILKNTSTRQNRILPKLDYQIVYDMKRQFPDIHMTINGGISTIDEGTTKHLPIMDGIMLGRASYKHPLILTTVDEKIYGISGIKPDINAILETMIAYAHKHVERGGKLHHVMRHMLGLFHSVPHAKLLRKALLEL